MPQVLMNFQHYDDWVVHFIEADCRSTIGQRTSFFHFATLDELRAFVTRCYPDGTNLEEFENNVRAWSRGSIYVNLSDEQYAAIQTRRP